MKNFKSKHIKRCEKILKYVNNIQFIKNYSLLLGSDLFKEYDKAINLITKTKDYFLMPSLYEVLLHKYMYIYENLDFQLILDKVNNELKTLDLQPITLETLFLMAKSFSININDELRHLIYSKFLSAPLYDFKENLTDKTLLYIFEFGYGDNIWKFLFLQNIIKNNNKIIFICPEALHRLIKNSFLNVECFDFPHNNIKNFFNKLHYDYFLLTSTTFDSSNKHGKYLKVNNLDVINFKKSLKNKFNIGITYTSESKHPDYICRNTKINYFEPLTKINGVQLYSLQYGKNDDEFKNLNIINLGKNFKDLYDTAVAIESMDLIITIDTVTLHLAGALCKKTFAVFNNKPKSSPSYLKKTYNNIKVFQNDKTDNWAKTIKEVEKEVRKLFAD